MSRINQIKKALMEKGVKDYKITEINEKTYEQFYVIQKLETVRQTNTLEDSVTVYKEIEIDGKKLLGSASLLVQHELSKSQLFKEIDKALFSASLIHNEYYELVEGQGKKTKKLKVSEESPKDVLQNIAKIFIEESKELVKFNSLELFYNIVDVRLVNSKGVDYSKSTYKIEVEAIPSSNEGVEKTELYRMFKYNKVDYNKVREDARNAISDVHNRSIATKLDNSNKINVVLHDRDVSELVWETISTCGYASVYNGSNLHKVGDYVQDKPVTPLNISLDKLSDCNFFDEDGVILHKTEIVKDGVLKSYYGNSRFAYYLKTKATGHLSKLVLKEGTKSIEEFKDKPYIEIVDLSGIQVDVFASYLGGEVRLGLYHDGNKVVPVTGFTFTANLNEALSNMELSSETTDIDGYIGPKYMIVKNVEVL